MRSLPLLCLLATLCVGCVIPVSTPYEPAIDLGRDTLVQTDALAQAVNAYRAQLGLPAVRMSPSLTVVATRHVIDLEKNRPDVDPCNLHSWSANGAWTHCCYTHENPPAACMWNKPAEITRNAYPGYGFEIAYKEVGDHASVSRAVSGWKGSPAHDDVIANRGAWADLQWNAIGAAMSAHYAVVWFGREPDPVADDR